MHILGAMSIDEDNTRAETGRDVHRRMYDERSGITSENI